MNALTVQILISLLFTFVGSASATTEAIVQAGDQLRAAAGDSRVIVLGEMHGTTETPQLVQALAESYARTGPVLVALEIWDSENEAISAYLSSTGDQAARTHLRQQPFWQVDAEHNDGRRTECMLGLLDSLRAMRAQGRDIAVLPYDPRALMDGEQRSRDRMMADHIRAAFTGLQNSRLIMLTGNRHAMLKVPAFIGAGNMDSAAGYLLDLHPFTVNIAARAGNFWGCMNGQCGPQSIPTSDVQNGPPSGMAAELFHYQIVLPKFSAAPLIGEAGCAY